MWPLMFLGVMLAWLSRGSSIGLGQERVPQFPGAAGIVQTVSLMRAMVNQSIDHPLIRQQAARATEGVGRNNPKGAAVALGEWVRARIRYLNDPLHQEHLTNPVVFAKAINEGRKVFGDCDDMSMYVAALAKSIGLQPTFHAVGRGNSFHHVYTEINGVAVDPTVSFGTKPFDAKKRISTLV